ncbi:hypothetical protein [Desulfococcus sp.]|uniref:hypothetical protein n=1 Tax=Desulfococcus sp. TaxID=2025834 RepID=UPI0035941B9F
MMTRKTAFKAMAMAVGLIAGGLLSDGGLPEGWGVGNAQAVIGRPLTPGSVAGVARRTTRRVIRRSTIYAASLPSGCRTVIVNGATLWQCGGTYYQAHNNQYVVVYVD